MFELIGFLSKQSYWFEDNKGAVSEDFNLKRGRIAEGKFDLQDSYETAVGVK